MSTDAVVIKKKKKRRRTEFGICVIREVVTISGVIAFETNRI